MGNVGIGTVNIENYKLNVNGSVSFSNYVNFSNSINQTNTLTSNILMGNVGIGTTTLPEQKLDVYGNIKAQQLYLFNPNQSLNAAIYFTPPTSIYSIFSKKVPWAMYFAEDYVSGTLPNYISNGRDASTSTNLIKTTAAGNGATGPITYISGTTSQYVTFPIGSIPTNFTILTLTRYNGSAKQRIIDTSGITSWFQGHHSNKRGVVFYDGWKTNSTSIGSIDDWLCVIGKNSTSTPNNILIDGVSSGVSPGGIGYPSLQLCINNNTTTPTEKSDWALSCIMIWDTNLTDDEIVSLNTIINNYKTSGNSIKSLITSTIDDDCIIENRIYSGNEKTELLLFKGNDSIEPNGNDRIRLKAANIVFDTYSTLTAANSRNTENIVMLISSNGNLGIGNTNPIAPLHIGSSIIATGISDGNLVISKNNGSTITRNFKFSYNSTNDDFIIGDYGFGSSSLNQVKQLIIQSGAYANSIRLNSTGDVDLVYDTSSSGTRRYANIGGLRIGGWDSNSIYNNTEILGLSTLNSITFNTGTDINNLNQRLIINTAGNIGIGSDSPRQKLDIIGNIKSNYIISDAFYLNNVKLENQSIYIFPPSGITGTPATFHTTSYGNGTYTISASSFASTKDPYFCFNGNLTDEWNPLTPPYTGTLNAYVGSVSTIVSGSNYLGEWIQIQYLRGFAATSITLSGISANNAKCPKEFILAGSIDSSNWILLSSNTGISDYTTKPSKNYNIYNNSSYYYYRIIITKTIGDSNLSISDISFTGTQNTNFTNLDNFNNIIYNTNEKQFPPYYYDTNSTEVISSNEIFNCIPANPYKQTITLNNHGTYTIYSSSTDGTDNNRKISLFNYFRYESRWQTLQYTNGAYSANTNYIKDNTYKGDWIIIKFPYKIILSKFIFYQKIVNNSPKTWKCYASNDGINFTEIYEANELIGATYSNGFTQKILPSLFDIPYLYIGWTFGSLIGTGVSTATQLELFEIQIFGKDDISNSLSNTWIKSGLNIYNTIGNVNIGSSSDYNYKLNVNGAFNASSISSNGYNLDLVYTKNTLTSNLLYNYSYSSVIRYPPKIFDTSSTYGNVNVSNEILNINPSSPLKEIITIQPASGYTNGIGEYIIYSSSQWSTNNKLNLFNFNNNNNLGQWSFNFTSYNGYFVNAVNYYIKSDYKGDWIIIKLPVSIILTSFKFTYFNIPERSPSLWRCYGSNDGINFIEIPEASNELIPLILTDYISNIYTKLLNNNFNTSYRYIGFTFNKVVGGIAGCTALYFSELELYGKEIISITPIYTTSNQVMTNPNILKKIGFMCSIETPVTINSMTFYKFDIDLTKYTSIQYLDTYEPYRIFKINIFKNSAYFSAINNDIPDILSYEIYMSNKLTDGTLSNETSGINICAVGYPINYKLDKIMPTSIFLMNNNNFNSISIISTSNINVRCIITDLLN